MAALLLSARISMMLLLLNACFNDVRCPDVDLSVIGRPIDEFCPYNVICRTGQPKVIINNPGQKGCCTDCSCEESCGLTQTCCFPSLDKYILVDRSHQKCILPNSYSDNTERGIGFNMIVDEFPNGSGIHCGDFETKCGENENATSIGSLYPVSDKKTGRIYKNIECAKCHGLQENDIIEWQVWLACNVENYLVQIDIMTSLNSIETGELSQFCGYEFVYPGPLLDIKAEQCVTNPVESCADDFEVYDYNLTREDVRNLCVYGVHSPYDVEYKNVFCYICSPYVARLLPKNTCRTDDVQDRLGMVSFAALMSTEALDRDIQEQQPIKLKHRVACPRENITRYGDDSPCRKVYCPTGQILRRDGECIYPSKYLRSMEVTLTIKLLPQINGTKVDTFLNKRKIYTDMLTNEDLSPWFSGWEVKLFAYTTKTASDGELFVDHFLVKLTQRRRKIDIASFLKYIQKSLSQDWHFYLNGVVFANKQMLSNLTEFARVFNKTGAAYTYTHVQYPSESLELPSFPIYVEIMSLYTLPSLQITKMFFCDQIQLRPEEYDLDIQSKTLFHKKQQRFFSLGEFSSIVKDEESFDIRICIEDSLFNLQQISNSESINSNCLRILSFFLFSMILKNN